jgi:hypothetical protein
MATNLHVFAWWYNLDTTSDPPRAWKSKFYATLNCKAHLLVHVPETSRLSMPSLRSIHLCSWPPTGYSSSSSRMLATSSLYWWWRLITWWPQQACAWAWHWCFCWMICVLATLKTFRTAGSGNPRWLTSSLVSFFVIKLLLRYMTYNTITQSWWLILCSDSKPTLWASVLCLFWTGCSQI